MIVSAIEPARVLAFRQHTNYLDKRLSSDRLPDAAFAGLKDSEPRSALLSLHARVERVSPNDWRDVRFVQVWGPRGAVYLVPKKKAAVFTLGFLPRDSINRARVETAADKAERIFRREKQRRLDVYFPDLRIASASGILRIEWDASRTTWWVVKRPKMDPELARLDLARRFLHSVGPANAGEYAWWAGVTPQDARQTFQSLGKELAEVVFEGRSSCILQTDLKALQNAVPTETVRLLPPGDPYLVVKDRRMLIPTERFRLDLWPIAPPPGALLVNGQIVGTWRRKKGRVNIHLWRRLGPETKKIVEREVVSIPIESPNRQVDWT